MNKILLIPVALVILVGGAFFLLNNTQKSQRLDEMEGESGQTNAESAPLGSLENRYIEYKDGVLEKNVDKRRVLFFYASWCPTCQPADAEFTKRKSEIPKDLILIRVNYNDPETDKAEKDLAKKYNITYQHTYVEIDDQGKEIKKWNGGKMDELIENVN